MPWTTEQKTFIIEAYFRLDSIRSAQTQFKKHFQYRVHPTHRLIYCWVNKFRDHGTANNLNSKDSNRISHSGRPKSITTPRMLMLSETPLFAAPASLCAGGVRNSKSQGSQSEKPCEKTFMSILTGYRLNINLLLMT